MVDPPCIYSLLPTSMLEEGSILCVRILLPNIDGIRFNC